MKGDLSPTFLVLFEKFKGKFDFFAVFSYLFSVKRNYL